MKHPFLCIFSSMQLVDFQTLLRNKYKAIHLQIQMKTETFYAEKYTGSNQEFDIEKRG